jgi:F0F1-type ATP synthase beta subunit
VLRRYKDLEDIITVILMDELSGRQACRCPARKIQRFLSQPSMCGNFTSLPATQLEVNQWIRRSYRMHDDVQKTFYMVGTIGEVLEKAKKLAVM